MNSEDSNKFICFLSIAFNIFLIAFILGRGHFFQSGMHNQPAHDSAAVTPQGPRGYGMLGHPSALMSQALFSRIEIEADRPYIEEHFERMHKIRKELAAQLRSGKATPESIKQHFAKIDAIMKEVKDHMREKAQSRINTMSPEEKSRLADILEK